MERLIARLDEFESRLTHFSNDLSVLKQLHDFEDPQAQLNKIRYISEGVLQFLCKEHNVNWGKSEPTLERMIGPLRAAKVIPAPVASHLRSIQSTTSPGSHYQKDKLTDSHCQIALLALVDVLDWYIKNYDRGTSSKTEVAVKDERRISKTKIGLIATVLFIMIVVGVLLQHSRTPNNHPSLTKEIALSTLGSLKANYSKRHFDMSHFVQLYNDSNQPEQDRLENELTNYRIMIRDYNIERGIYRLDIETIFGTQLYLWEREIHIELLYAGRNLECIINKKGDTAVLKKQALKHLNSANSEFRLFHQTLQGILDKSIAWPIPITRTKQPLDAILQNPC